MKEKKVWYIFKEKAHLGPFTWDDIEKQYQARKVKDDTALWKEGMKAWVSYSMLVNHHRKLKQQEEEKAQEIQRQQEYARKALQEQQAVEEQKELEEKMPPVPEVKSKDFLENDVIFPEREVEEVIFAPLPKENAPDLTQELAKEVNKSRRLNMKVLAISIVTFFLLVLIVLGGGFFYLKQWHHFNRPYSLGQADYERLYKTAQIPLESRVFELSFASAFSKVGDRLYIATNYPFAVDAVLTLTALPEDNLEGEEIQISSRAALKNGLFEFSRFDFQKGHRLLKGRYHVSLSLEKEGAENLFISLFWKMQDFSFSHQESVLLGFPHQRAFDNAILKKQKEKKALLESHLVQVRQKMETMKALWGQLAKDFSYVFNAKLVKNEIKVFTMRYQNGAGRLLTQMFFDNNQDLIKEMAFEEGEQVLFEMLDHTSRKIAGKVSNLINRLESIIKLNMRQKTRLKKEMASFTNQLQADWSKLEQEIQKREKEL